MEEIFDSIVHLKEQGWTEEQIKIALSKWKRLSRKERAFVLALGSLNPKSQSGIWQVLSEAPCDTPSTSKEQTQKELHEAIKAASNEEILRKQLELLAEYPRMPDGNSQIPACSREMVQIYRELVKAEIRAVLLPVGLFGVSLSVLYGLGVSLVKFANRK